MAGISKTIAGRYHFIGIGGIGMSGVARLFLSRGACVSGSDLRTNRVTEELERSGARIFLGHEAGNVLGAASVVYSSAIRQDNPEIVEAKRLGIPLVMRAQALAELMQDRTVVTVSGSHGKTTTTSLVSLLLLEAGLEPTVAVGGILKNIGVNARHGGGEFFVAEADESDGSFLYYNPDYSIITNIDREHLDYYGTFDKELEVFAQFVERTRPQGCVILCGDDPNLRVLAQVHQARRIFFGMDRSNDIYADGIHFAGLSSEFDCFYKGGSAGRFQLSLGGRHNISNALAVIALGMELGIDTAVIKKTLSSYKGAGRRLEIKYQGQGVTVIDDYAHHPSEIRATLAALKNLAAKRTIAVFQPHRYTRAKLLMEDFAASFNDADRLIITDIYAAGEPALEGVSSQSIFEKIKTRSRPSQALYLPKEKIVEHILSELAPGDLVVMLGAGDITKISDELAQSLKGKSPDAGAA